ncbi:hypothetical protein AMELA_G00194340 [Ameiurus melas]|uniref:Uncharacterized protein n=1 Tax=Ameiurus melas TaxID=219545 RepID=A0A7J6A968_AMEME|nr:hypothetical protein AMELA_G00194340 [Ameiurus melas]
MIQRDLLRFSLGSVQQSGERARVSESVCTSISLGEFPCKHTARFSSTLRFSPRFRRVLRLKDAVKLELPK